MAEERQMREPPHISAYEWTCELCGFTIGPNVPHECPVHGYSDKRLLWEIRAMLMRLEDKIDQLECGDHINGGE